MRLVLYEIQSGIASEKMNDDGFELWFKIKNENKYKASAAAFYSRHNIRKGKEYKYIVFLDTETGELLEINALPKMHNAMVKYNLYPEFILNGLNRTI